MLARSDHIKFNSDIFKLDYNAVSKKNVLNDFLFKI